MKVLALDFDGVISDSAPEAFVVALRAYTDLRPKSRFANHLRNLEKRDGPTPEVIQGDRLYGDFVELMPLGNRAEDYAVVLTVLECGIRVPDQAAYDEQRAARPPDFLEAFHRRFYRVRRDFRSDDPARWRALLGPYPGLIELLRRRAGDVELAIATAKDRDSVGVLLGAYGIADLFPEDRILDKEAGVSKRAHLEHLVTRLAVAPEALTFVDDKVNHLEEVADLGVRCALAAWGYNGEREQRTARERGFLVCDLAHVEKQLFD
ncbi:MAG: hypothetical protein O7G30_08900 [Proteobacteria bacterium]|nr:hypothetical protein [Pseudomonadota bacterium]